jgi:hypothetical protein
VIATLAHLDPEKLEILPHLDTPPADRISTAASGIGIFLQIEKKSIWLPNGIACAKRVN